jgi:hypothetical protein
MKARAMKPATTVPPVEPSPPPLPVIPPPASPEDSARLETEEKRSPVEVDRSDRQDHQTSAEVRAESTHEPRVLSVAEWDESTLVEEHHPALVEELPSNTGVFGPAERTIRPMPSWSGITHEAETDEQRAETIVGRPVEPGRLLIEEVDDEELLRLVLKKSGQDWLSTRARALRLLRQAERIADAFATVEVAEERYRERIKIPEVR